MATTWMIPVTADGEQLQLPNKTVPLGPGDSVVWIFDFEIADGQRPLLALSEASGRAARGPFGPFTQLTLFHGGDDGPFRICASGFGGDTSRVTYRAELWSGAAELDLVKVSNYASLTFDPSPNLSAGSQQVTVSLALRSPHPEPHLVPELEVSPQNVSIVPGEPVVWNFALPLNLLEEAWYPEVVFTNPGRPYGPFETMSILVEPAGTDPILRRVKLIGTGHRGEPGIFSYICRVQGAAGLLAVSSDDPTVDDDGELMTPPDFLRRG